MLIILDLGSTNIIRGKEYSAQQELPGSQNLLIQKPTCEADRAHFRTLIYIFEEDRVACSVQKLPENNLSLMPTPM